MIKSDAEIYKVLERHLRATGDKPLTCVDLYNMPDVRAVVPSSDAVSNHLGHMWRRKIVKRWFSPKTNTQRSRYGYTWESSDDVFTPDTREPKAREPKAREPDSNVVRLTAMGGPRKTEAEKPNVVITEGDNEIVLDFNDFTVTIRRK